MTAPFLTGDALDRLEADLRGLGDSQWRQALQVEDDDAGLCLYRKGRSRAYVHAADLLAETRGAPPSDAGGRAEGEDAQPYKDALHALVMLKAQDDIGCVPPPTKEQWSKAWAEAEDLVRVEP